MKRTTLGVLPSVFSAGLAMLGSAVFLLPSLLSAGFYTWKDNAGTIHYTDNYASIPAAYRNRAVADDQGGEGRTGVLAQETPQRVVVHFERQDNVIVVQAVLNWKLPVLFHLDTGASCTMITREDALALGIVPDGQATVKGYIADGSMVELATIVLPSLAVGGAEVNNIEVVIGKMRLLGMDFLREFYMTVDAGRGQLVLERKDGGREQEAASVTEEKTRSRSELKNHLEQMQLAIKAKESVIEQLLADIRDSEEKRERLESLIEDIRTSTRFESSDISFDADTRNRIEKYQDALVRLNRHIEIRKHEMAIQQKQIDEFEEKMDYYDRLIMKLR